jgi:5-methyltetrahydrofolate--homocysteine methyltransferase
MHSAFLYHAIKAGMDMAIVNPSMLQVYDDIEPELLKCVEDVIFDTDAQATERLIAKAADMMAAKESKTGTEGTTDSIPASGKTVEERLKEAIVKGRSENLQKDLSEAMEAYGEAVKVIEGPLMAGMEHVGQLFGEGKMFLPQVVKAAKVMRDAVDILSPYMELVDRCSDEKRKKNVMVIATVKGDVHDIGKNILGIVMTCNGFEVHDLGVMVDKETILNEAQKLGADIIAVSGLITPSLYQMEEICREMTARGMQTPLMIGGATTSALHTAVKLAPLYDHVFYGSDASASAVLAKRCMMDREKFEAQMHAEQQNLRDIYHKKADASNNQTDTAKNLNTENKMKGFDPETYPTICPQDIPTQEIPAEEVMPYFDWKMFYAIWGVKYGSAVPEAAELMQLRRDAEEEIKFGDFKIMLSARFMNGYTENDDIVAIVNNSEIRLPMMRQETFKMQSLSDFVIAKESGRTSPFGAFAICVSKRSSTHEEGCSCPACNSRYEDMIGKTVRQTIAEAASKWLSIKVEEEMKAKEPAKVKVIKPAAGYSSCPDHTLKKDILALLGECTEMHGHDCSCGCQGHGHGHKHSHADEHKFTTRALGIKMTESYAMTPDASICGLIFMHPQAGYPEIRTISKEQYESYISRRGMDHETARRFLGHLV